jgi:hypothetical protein
MIDIQMNLKVKDIKGVSHMQTFKKIKNELHKDLQRMILFRRDVNEKRAPDNAESTMLKKGTNHWMFDTGDYVAKAFIATSENNYAQVELSDETPPKSKRWTYKDIGLFHSQNNCKQFGISVKIKERAKQYTQWLLSDIRYAMRKAPWRQVK